MGATDQIIPWDGVDAHPLRFFSDPLPTFGGEVPPVLPRFLCSQDHMLARLVKDHDHTRAIGHGSVVPIETTVRGDLDVHWLVATEQIIPRIRRMQPPNP